MFPLTHGYICWGYHWTTCHNMWRWWDWAGVDFTRVGTRVRWSHARTEENGGPVHLPDLCYIVNTGMAAVREDTSRRSSPWVCDCHWGVYLWVQHSDAGEVEESGGVDNSGGVVYNVHLWSRNCTMEVKVKCTVWYNHKNWFESNNTITQWVLLVPSAIMISCNYDNNDFKTYLSVDCTVMLFVPIVL